jgi:hypothetical protein
MISAFVFFALGMIFSMGESIARLHEEAGWSEKCLAATTQQRVYRRDCLSLGDLRYSIEHSFNRQLGHPQELAQLDGRDVAPFGGIVTRIPS